MALKWSKNATNFKKTDHGVDRGLQEHLSKHF
jgi:hypothetical protein